MNWLVKFIDRTAGMFRLCWHDWGRWSRVIESYGGSQHQVRQCKKCGAISRRLAIHIMGAQLSASQVNDAVDEANMK